jgi:AAA domain/Bifunctional DNA primase/polymerase, N-terminal
MPEQNPMLEAALGYLRQGWSVVPLCPPDHAHMAGVHLDQCRRPGKTPFRRWKIYQERLPREGEIRSAWEQCPTANVGVIFGKVSGMIGIDVDGGREGVELLMELSGGVDLDTAGFRTPGDGFRFLYSIPRDLLVKSRTVVRGNGRVELLGEGRYSVFPPSLHRNGGRYERSERMDSPNASFAPWILGWSQASASPGSASNGQLPLVVSVDDRIRERVRRYLRECDPCISGRGGSPQAYKIACKLTKGFHLSVEVALSLVLENYNQRCDPPWSEREWLHHLTNAAQNGTCPQDFTAETRNGHVVPNAPVRVEAPAVAAPAAVVVRVFEEIMMEEISWLWPGWLPLGKLCVLDGDPGLGKSTMLLDLAARISRHGQMPDGSQGLQGRTLVLSGEDSDGDTIKPRLMAAGADELYVHSLSCVADAKGKRPLCLPDDLDLMREYISAMTGPPFRLIIIDPLFAFLVGVDSSKDQEVRRALMHLRDFAEEKQVCVICLRHLNKGGGTKALYRGGGSIGIIGAARTGLVAARHPDNVNQRVLGVQKANLAAMPQSLLWRLVPTPLHVCSVEWLGDCSLTADELVKDSTPDEVEERQEKRTLVREAMDFLEHLLRHGAVAVKQCRLEARRNEVSGPSLRRAARNLNVRLTYHDPLAGGQNSWRLPNANEGTNESERQSAQG